MRSRPPRTPTGGHARVCRGLEEVARHERVVCRSSPEVRNPRPGSHTSATQGCNLRNPTPKSQSAALRRSYR
eukprot:9392975-Alexandrium_andersonii.AAC.1